jgi:hypothetical protein
LLDATKAALPPITSTLLVVFPIYSKSEVKE